METLTKSKLSYSEQINLAIDQLNDIKGIKNIFFVEKPNFYLTEDDFRRTKRPIPHSAMDEYRKKIARKFVVENLIVDGGIPEFIDFVEKEINSKGNMDTLILMVTEDNHMGAIYSEHVDENGKTLNMTFRSTII